MGPWSKFLQLSSKKSIMTSIENEYFIIIIVIIIIIIIVFFFLAILLPPFPKMNRFIV